ncbi:hypothetical protein M1614_01400 [Candidatus Marsarchaeota archaeon]|nr:hypothetical protein [Candidatus Marsarchaeota archaeon]
MENEHTDSNIIEGIVSSIKKAMHASEEYTIVSNKVININSKIKLDLYDKVRVDYTTENDHIRVEGVEIIGRKCLKEYRDILQNLVSEVNIERNKRELLERLKKPIREITLPMLQKMLNSADMLLRSFISGAPIIIRFHGDGDGAIGSIALYKALEKIQKKLFLNERGMKWLINKGITYDLESFYLDSMFFNDYKSVEKPIICIIDFGTNFGSNDAIKNINDRYNLIWLDHHNIEKEFIGVSKQYINPLEYGGTSDFTAGFLTGIFSELIAEVRIENLKEAALISDMSVYANRENYEAGRIATVVDFITGIRESTGYLDGPISPKYLVKILENQEKMNSMYSYANELIKEAIDAGMQSAKSYKSRNGITINIINFEKIASRFSGYLLPGRYSSKLHNKFESINKKSITIVVFRNYISFRIGRSISDEVNILEIIKDIKSNTEFVESGGGHKEAASMKIDETKVNIILKLVLNKLEIK